MSANDRQIGGDHYRKKAGVQHWDYAISKQMDLFQYVVTKYVERWRDKNGIADLEKALHYLEKYIETVKADIEVKPIVPFNTMAHEILKNIKPLNNPLYEKAKEDYEKSARLRREHVEAEQAKWAKQAAHTEPQPTGMHHPFGYCADDED